MSERGTEKKMTSDWLGMAADGSGLGGGGMMEGWNGGRMQGRKGRGRERQRGRGRGGADPPLEVATSQQPRKNRVIFEVEVATFSVEVATRAVMRCADVKKVQSLNR